MATAGKIYHNLSHKAQRKLASECECECEPEASLYFIICNL